jgi:nitrogen fixation protein FixH
MSQTRTEPSPITGRTVLACLIAFFGVVIGVNAVMVKFALDTLPGAEVPSAYRASIRFNAEIARAKAQEARHWQIGARVERAPDGRALVQVDARDAGGAPLTGFVFSARLSRPTDARADRAVVLSERGNGVYRGTVDDVPAGQWDLVIQAERGEERVFLSRNRVVLK